LDENYKAGEDGGEAGPLAKHTTQVRGFIERHEGHDITLRVDGDHDFAELDVSARNILLQEAIYRRHWVATMSDQTLLKLPGVGPKVLGDIRRQISYSGPPEAATKPEWERCPTCQGTGPKLSDAALRSSQGHM